MIWLPGVLSQIDNSHLPKWAIYEIVQGAVKDSSGTASIVNTYTKRVGSGYHIDSNGMFVLDNVTTKPMSALSVGDYLVNVSNTSSSTATTGSALYRVTGVTPQAWVVSKKAVEDHDLSYMMSVDAYKSFTQRSSDGYFVLSAQDAVTIGVPSMEDSVPYYSNSLDFDEDAGGTYNKIYELYHVGYSVYVNELTPAVSSTTDFSYDTYTVSAAKGDYVGAIRAPVGTYPDDGIQDGYWYVLVEAGEEPSEPETGVKYVDYIQSTGTQYIKTEVVPAYGYTAELGFTATSVSSSVESWIIGVFDLNVTNYPRMRCGIVEGAYYTDSSNGAVYTGTPGSYTTATVGVSRSGCTIPLILFGQNERTGAAHVANSKYRLYFCKIRNANGELVRDYRPCLDPDGVACLYDEVNTEYVYNAGSGTFLYGLA